MSDPGEIPAVKLSSTQLLGFKAPQGGPRDLAALLLEKRQALAGQEVGAWLFGDLSNDGVERLIDCAHELSFRQDEGRYPRLAIFVPSRRDNQSLEGASVRFDPPVPLDVRTLRRLSSAVPPRPSALFIRSVDGALSCVGIGRFETAGAHLPEDMTGLYHSSSGLVIEIGGPGDLTAHEAGDVFALSAGRLSRQFDGREALSNLPQFDWLRDEAVAMSIEDPNQHVIERAGQVVRDTWLYVLKETVRLAHGGSFAILPEDATSVLDLPEDWRRQIQVTYPTAPRDLLGSIAKYINCRYGDGSGSRQAALRELQDHASAIARLSATDGYVILDARLRLLGFGAKIGFEAPMPRKCIEVNDQLEPTGQYAGLHRTGTRHRAAYRLCQSVTGSLVFVVSQDGALRVFFGTESGDVRITAALEPITQLFQGL